MVTVVSTVTGKRVTLPVVDPKSFDIEDLAHPIAMQCRYNGQVKVFYSVAEHCTMIAKALLKTGKGRHLALEGLLHDAAEAFTGDMVKPLKERLLGAKDNEFSMIEHYTSGAIMKRYKLDHCIKTTDQGYLYVPSEEVKELDKSAFMHECFVFNRLNSPQRYDDRFDGPCGWLPYRAKKEYLKLFTEILHDFNRIDREGNFWEEPVC